jgi:hypothetical protein
MGALVFLASACLLMPGLAAASAQTPSSTPAPSGQCQLLSANGAKHVIYIQFDNTHSRRDNPNVPSDLEQMPHLRNFITNNGTLMTNDHTVLISHTATGILTSLTGVYPDRMGQPVSNSFRYFKTDGTTRTGVAFAYWTAPLFDPAGSTTDTTPEMINENGKIAPAPWVPYTRAGCNFGAVATANTILENTAIDIPTVFGANSPEAAEVAAKPAQAFADFVGIGVHCAAANALCSAANNGKPDLLPDEPGGYNGYNGLFGAKYVNPQISPNGPLTDLDGHVIQDASGHVGFPGFDGMEATVSLSYVAAMQEHGVPVTYAYISDAHDGHGTAGNIHFAYGPGETGYTQQLADYDRAFQQFFDRLAADGINKSNTLFVFTVDEGDHFAGDPPTPAGCDGINTPCTYNRVGEINADLARMIRTQYGDTTPFTVHSDDAPTVYVTGKPGPTSTVARNLERESAGLSWLNPYSGQVQKDITVALADPVEEKTLHMVTADPARTPTFTLFADPDWFFFATGGTSTCATPDVCASIPARTSQSFAWNHGDIQDEIASTWVGYVGPSVEAQGTSTVWSDHTDVRPTMLAMLGLADDYGHDGRVVTQVIRKNTLPVGMRQGLGVAQQLGDVYKKLNASFGTFAMNTLKASTTALASDSASDTTYSTITGRITDLTSQRNSLAGLIKGALDAYAVSGQPLDVHQAQDWIGQANGLLSQAAALAS